MSNEIEAYAINRGIDMARVKNPVRWHLTAYRFFILDNPYKHSSKKLSAAWHNAFRVECKKLKRLSR